MTDIIVGALILAACAVSLYFIIRRKGKCRCCGSCTACKKDKKP